MLCLGDALAVDFRQTIHKVVAGGCQAEVLGKVDDFDGFGYIVCGDERFALAMTQTEENHIDVGQRQFIGEHYVGVTIKTFVYVSDTVAGIALTMDEHYLCLWMMNQQSYQFAGGISCTTDNAYFDHELMSW